MKKLNRRIVFAILLVLVVFTLACGGTEGIVIETADGANKDSIGCIMTDCGELADTDW